MARGQQLVPVICVMHRERCLSPVLTLLGHMENYMETRAGSRNTLHQCKCTTGSITYSTIVITGDILGCAFITCVSGRSPYVAGLEEAGDKRILYVSTVLSKSKERVVAKEL